MVPDRNGNQVLDLAKRTRADRPGLSLEVGGAWGCFPDAALKLIGNQECDWPSHGLYSSKYVDIPNPPSCVSLTCTS